MRGWGDCCPEDPGGPPPGVCWASKAPPRAAQASQGGICAGWARLWERLWAGAGTVWTESPGRQWGRGVEGDKPGEGACLTSAAAAGNHVRMMSVWTSVVVEAVTPDP